VSGRRQQRSRIIHGFPDEIESECGKLTLTDRRAASGACTLTSLDTMGLP